MKLCNFRIKYFMRIFKKVILIYIFFFCSLSCSTHYCVQENNSNYHHYSFEHESADSLMLKKITPYKTYLDNNLNMAIAHSDIPLEKNADCNNLAELVFQSLCLYSDSILTDTAAYMVLLNYGGLRSNLPKGDVTKRNIFELMPFDNQIVILQINEEQKSKIMEFSMKEKKLLLKQNKNKPTFILVTSDYLYNGGDNCNFLSSAKKISTANTLIRDIIINYCQKKKNITQHCFYSK